MRLGRCEPMRSNYASSCRHRLVQLLWDGDMVVDRDVPIWQSCCENHDWKI